MFGRTMGAGLGVFMLAPALALAQTPTLNCDDTWDGDEERFCEIRDFTVSPGGTIRIDGGPNGGVRVHGWDGSTVRVFAMVQAHAPSEERAQAIATEVEIATDGTIRARGPRTERRQWWAVSFEAFVPRRSDLDLETTNGGIRIRDVHGNIRFEVTNGGVILDGLGGNVSGRSTNGSIRLTLTGETWDGAGVDVRTTNGSVAIAVPDGYAAHLETGTTNGAMRFDFPVMVQGRLNKRVAVDLDGGGPPIKVTTTNGGVTVRRPEI